MTPREKEHIFVKVSTESMDLLILKSYQVYCMTRPNPFFFSCFTQCVCVCVLTNIHCKDMAKPGPNS